MNKRDDMNQFRRTGWMRAHSSVLFLIALLVAGTALLVVGVFLSGAEDARLEGAGVLLSQFASVILATCMIGVFFAFRDVREAFVATLGELLFEAGIVKHMGDRTKDRLERRVAEAALPEQIVSIDPSLYDFLRKVRSTCSQLPIMRNYHESITFSPHPLQPELIVYSDVISYKLDAQHFKDSVAVIPYKFCFAFANPMGTSTTEASKHIEFSGKLGGRTLGASDLALEPYQYGTYPMLLARLATQLTIRGGVDVRLSFRTSKPFFDNAETTYVRYPCLGFTVSLHFLPTYHYDYAWFSQWSDVSSSLPRIGEHQAEQTGITISTNEWMLPGEGVVLSWYKPVGDGPRQNTGEKP